MTVKIILEGEVKYTGEIGVGQAAQILNFIDASSRGSVSESVLPVANSVLGTGLSRRKVSPRQAISESLAKTNPQKIVALAKYVCDKQGQEYFSKKEIQLGFQRAGGGMPKNIGRDLRDAIELGYIAPSEDTPDEFFLTEFGEEQIAKQFIEAPRKRTNRKPSGKKRRRRGDKTQTADYI